MQYLGNYSLTVLQLPRCLLIRIDVSRHRGKVRFDFSFVMEITLQHMAHFSKLFLEQDGFQSLKVLT